MDTSTRNKLIAQYKDGYRVVAEALAGATDEDLDARPAPGKWSAREVVHHLADSEMTAAVRARLLIAIDNAQIQGYDQDRFAQRLYYNRPIEASVEAFKSARRTTFELLEKLTEAEWKRAGTHTEHGSYSLERWLEIYAPHAHNHAEQIRVARGAARKSRSQ
jgi:DinB family protein